jgi:hypothetical protein
MEVEMTVDMEARGEVAVCSVGKKGVDGMYEMIHHCSCFFMEIYSIVTALKSVGECIFDGEGLLFE